MLLTRIWDAVPTLIVVTLNLMAFASDTIQDVTFRVFEHPPGKQLIGNIFQAARLHDHVRSVRLDSVKTEWLSLFSLDRPTGNLYTSDRATSALDREAICPSHARDPITRVVESQCILNLLASVNNRILIKVNIILEDLNDNSPVFPNTSLDGGSQVQTFTVDESLSIETTKIHLQLASDSDESGSQKIYYYLSSNDTTFNLIHRRKSESRHGLEELYLVPNKPLDYETQSDYWMKLTACDAEPNQKKTGKRMHCTTQTIHVLVNNLDDEKPVFEQKNYTILLKASASVGQELFTVKAVDSDAPPFDNVRYYLLSTTDTQKDLLHIDATTGIIQLKRKVPGPGVYRFFVIATSSPNSNITSIYADLMRQNLDRIYSQSNVASVLVHVIDTNNHAPSVTLQNSKDTANHLINMSTFPQVDSAVFLQIFETATVPHVLAYFRVVDPDSAENADTRCALHSSKQVPSDLSSLFISENISDFFVLTQVSRLTEHVTIYRLVLNRTIDAERLVKERQRKSGLLQRDIFGGLRVAGIAPIQIRCEDAGDPVLEGTLLVLLVVMDDDEHLPQLEITLPDGSQLDPVVQATNRKPRLVYNMSLSENTAIGQPIFRVSVSDNDVLSQPLFELHDNTSHVWLNKSSGYVYLKKPYDYETAQIHCVELFVKELLNPSITSLKLNALVYIHIQDENDNAPIFTLPVQIDHNAHSDVYFGLQYRIDAVRVLRVAEELPEATRLGQVSAIDKDSGSNAEIRYFIVDTKLNRYSNFTVPEVTNVSPDLVNTVPAQMPSIMVNNEGFIWSKGRLDREAFTSLDVLVGAHDLGTPSLTSYTCVRIVLTDVNDHEPRWQFPSEQDYIIVVPLDSEIHSTVTRVRAIDPDDSRHNGRLSYSLLLPNESARVVGTDTAVQMRLARSFFQVDERNGEIVLRQSLYSLPSGFLDIWLTVTDHGDNRRYSLAKLVSYLAKPHEETQIEQLAVKYRDKSQLIVSQLRQSKSLDRVLSHLSARSAIVGQHKMWQNGSVHLPVLIGCAVCGLFLLIFVMIAVIIWKSRRRRQVRKMGQTLYTPVRHRSHDRVSSPMCSDPIAMELQEPLSPPKVSHFSSSVKQGIKTHHTEHKKPTSQSLSPLPLDGTTFVEKPSTSHVNSHVFQCRQEATLKTALSPSHSTTQVVKKVDKIAENTYNDGNILTFTTSDCDTNATYIPVNSFINFPPTIPLKILTLSPTTYPMTNCLSESDSDQSYLNFPNIITSIVPVCHVQPDFIPICSSPSAASSTLCDSLLIERSPHIEQQNRVLGACPTPLLLTTATADPTKMYKDKLDSYNTPDPLGDTNHRDASDSLNASVHNSNAGETSPLFRPT